VDIIPVIDVRGGQAVRAVGGDRANYQPLVSPLAASSAPDAVAAGLMALYPFPVIYVADLDGIEGRGAAMSMIRRLASTYVGKELWVDNGARTLGEVHALLGVCSVCCIIGSETGLGVAELRELTGRYADRIILSLDFRLDGYVGDPALLAEPGAWPSRVIVMTLGAVGRSAGPDLARLAQVRALETTAKLYAAGGIRDIGDIDHARQAGAAGALIASALHAQTITADDLCEVTGRRSFVSV
jgi:phosphoribosyl isomerase A